MGAATAAGVYHWLLLLLLLLLMLLLMRHSVTPLHSVAASPAT